MVPVSRIATVILQLYILRQLLTSIAFSIAGIGLVVLPTITVQAIHKLGAVSMVAVFRFLPLVMVELIPYLLPIAFLLGVVATYGRMAAERELVAIRMAGIHPARIALPGIVIALGLSFWTAHLLSSVSPEWKYQQRNFARHADIDAFQNFAGGRTELEFGDSSLKAGRAYGNVFEEVLLDLTGDDGKPLTVSAARAELLIQDGMLYIKLEDAYVSSESGWVENERPFWSRPMDELFPFKAKDKTRPKFMSSSEMAVVMAEGELEPSRVNEFVFEIHRRRALSVTYLIFLLIGIPTGIALRSSTQLGAFTGAVVYAFLYYVLAMRLGQELALNGTIPPVVAAWTTNGLFVLVGCVLLYRTLWR